MSGGKAEAGRRGPEPQWTHPSVLQLMESNTKPYHGEKLSVIQMAVMNFLRRTNGFSKDRFVGDRFASRTLRSLRRKGLIEHSMAGHYYLTTVGQDWRAL